MRKSAKTLIAIGLTALGLHTAMAASFPLDEIDTLQLKPDLAHSFTLQNRIITILGDVFVVETPADCYGPSFNRTCSVGLAYFRDTAGSFTVHINQTLIGHDQIVTKIFAHPDREYTLTYQQQGPGTALNVVNIQRN